MADEDNKPPPENLVENFDAKPNPRDTSAIQALECTERNKKMIVYEYLAQGMNPEDFFKELDQGTELLKRESGFANSHDATRRAMKRGQTKAALQQLKKAKADKLANRSVLDDLDFSYPSSDEDAPDSGDEYSIVIDGLLPDDEATAGKVEIAFDASFDDEMDRKPAAKGSNEDDSTGGLVVNAKKPVLSGRIGIKKTGRGL